MDICSLGPIPKEVSGAEAQDQGLYRVFSGIRLMAQMKSTIQWKGQARVGWLSTTRPRGSETLTAEDARLRITSELATSNSALLWSSALITGGSSLGFGQASRFITVFRVIPGTLASGRRVLPPEWFSRSYGAVATKWPSRQECTAFEKQRLTLKIEPALSD